MPAIGDFKIKRSKGRPITRSTLIVGDAAFDSDDIRDYNRRRGIKSNIAINERNKKKPKAGRPKKFDKELYKKRSAIERY